MAKGVEQIKPYKIERFNKKMELNGKPILKKRKHPKKYSKRINKSQKKPLIVPNNQIARTNDYLLESSTLKTNSKKHVEDAKQLLKQSINYLSDKKTTDDNKTLKEAITINGEINNKIKDIHNEIKMIEKLLHKTPTENVKKNAIQNQNLYIEFSQNEVKNEKEEKDNINNRIDINKQNHDEKKNNFELNTTPYTPIFTNPTEHEIENLSKFIEDEYDSDNSCIIA